MTRPLGTALVAEVQKARLVPILMLEFDTADGPVRAWSGYGDLTWSAKVFHGIGSFGGISATQESTDGAAKGIVYSLSGIPQDLVATSLQSIRQGKIASLYLAVLDEKTIRMIGQPICIARHFTDVPTLSDDGATAMISLSCESRAIDQARPRIRRYNTHDQQIDDPTDRGFEFVPFLQNAQILFGSAGPTL